MTYIQLNEMENKESYRQQQENELEVIQVSWIKILPSYYGSSAWYILLFFKTSGINHYWMKEKESKWSENARALSLIALCNSNPWGIFIGASSYSTQVSLSIC